MKSIATSLRDRDAEESYEELEKNILQSVLDRRMLMSIPEESTKNHARIPIMQ